MGKFEQTEGQLMMANYRAPLDAAMTLLLHIILHWRRASERGCWT